MPSTEQVRSRLGDLAAQIEAEMLRIGMWRSDLSVEHPPAELAPFGGRHLSFEGWLQVVFVPALRDVAAGGRPVPHGSQVYDKAVREWRMWGEPLAEVDELMRLLQTVDELVVEHPH